MPRLHLAEPMSAGRAQAKRMLDAGQAHVGLAQPLTRDPRTPSNATNATIEHYRVLSSTIEHYRALSSTIEYHRVLSSIIEYYRRSCSYVYPFYLVYIAALLLPLSFSPLLLV